MLCERCTEVRLAYALKPLPAEFVAYELHVCDICKREAERLKQLTKED